MLSHSNIVTLIEIMLAEALFLFSFPKRDKFWLRFFGFSLTAFLVVVIIPDGNRYSANLLDRVYLFVRYMSLFAISVLVMLGSFKASFSAVISACSAGYAVQHASSRFSILVARLVPLRSLIASWGVPGEFSAYVQEALVFPFVYLLAYIFFGRRTKNEKYFASHNNAVNILSILMVMVCIGISRLDREYSVLIYPVAMCIFALLVQINLTKSLSLREENSVLQRLMKEESKRYEISKENMDLLNVKFHDLKYQLASLEGRLPPEELDTISRAINIYDRNVKTGSEVVDVILAEKMVRCDGLGIELTCMGDFGALDFMDTADAYAFFGNAIDNAIEAVSRIGDKEKRQISVTAEKRGDPVVVTVSNYYEGEIKLSEGQLQTTKATEPGYHGFGMKSMRMIAQKYGGNISFTCDGTLFSLSAYFMKS